MPSKEQVAPSVHRHVATVITIVILAAIAPAQTSTFIGQLAPFGPASATNQFAPYSPPTFNNGQDFDHVTGEWINYEPPLTKGILVTADGNFVVSVHEADQRISVRDAITLQLRAEIVVGHGPVALAERGSLTMATPVGHVNTSSTNVVGGGFREIWVVLRNQMGSPWSGPAAPIRRTGG